MTLTGEVVKPVEDDHDSVAVLNNDTYETDQVDISSFDGDVSVDDTVVYEMGPNGYRLLEVDN